MIQVIPGIIPARAGFTALSRRSYARPGDHPRSRGVYGSEIPRALGSKGSAPLARGLRRSQEGVLHTSRIIPARAGFTGTTQHHRITPEDHPRSRGVYLDEHPLLR